MLRGVSSKLEYKRWTQNADKTQVAEFKRWFNEKTKQKVTTTQFYMNQERKSKRQNGGKIQGYRIQETRGETRREHGNLTPKLHNKTDKDTEKHRG